ncbi:MAG: glycosyltransferase [Mariprofundaceae bacterium]|nr:glycosyltransferase [Mariprofundaceae bacterium]
MKILHLITRMDRGGSAVNTLLSAIEQQRAGHQVTLAFGSSIESDMSMGERAKLDVDLQIFQDLDGCIIILKKMFRSLGWHDLQAYQELKNLCKEPFDIIHTHTSKTGALGRLAAIGSQAKIIHTPHGHIFHGYFGSLKTNLFIWIERYLAKKTDVLIALTYAERDDHLALDIGSEDQWQVIPSGVDIVSIRQGVRHYDNDLDITWDAVSVGRLVPIKGMERLITAWATVREIKPDARLVLVGDGEDREKLEALASSLKLSDAIYFAGWADPIAYLAKARCFALMSHNEGMGRVVVEAFAAGLPCVVSDVCGLRELVNDEVGCVVDAEQPLEVAKAIVAMWEKDVRQATWQRAQNYSLSTMIEKLEHVYQQTLLEKKKT